MGHEDEKVEGITKESTQQMIDEALQAYPEKGKKKRAPHLAPNDPAATSACTLEKIASVAPSVTVISRSGSTRTE